MEVLASVLGTVVVETCRPVCGSISSYIKSSVRWKLNLRNLDKEMKHLVDLRNDIKRKLESADKDGRSPLNKVNEWLRDVDEILVLVGSFQAEITANQNKLCRFSMHIRFGRQVKKVLNMVEKLLKAGNFPDGLVKDAAENVEYIPGPSIDDQTTTSRTLDELMKLLNDEENFRRIGVWGMGGVGKTTLVKNLNNKLKGNTSLKHPFSIVIWATVSKELDMKRVQMQIAERLNLEVKIEESIERTAGRLYRRLKEERFLIILDDVWGKIDLDCLGVPQSELQKGSKIILTSRFLEVCKGMMTDMEVKVSILNAEEAWKLFSQNAGEVVGLEHIRPFAEEVVQECCGLPLAIITMGASMRGKKWQSCGNML